MTHLPDEPTSSRYPTRKVTAATLGAAVATICVLTVDTLTGVTTPTGIEGALATVLAFLGGYIVRESTD